jgi:hypothetical protein
MVGVSDCYNNFQTHLLSLEDHKQSLQNLFI